MSVYQSEALRPTQDMVRSALFSMLGERVKDAVFVDLFAGTGAVGIEAYSRGARGVIWVESDRAIARVLSESAQKYCGAAGRVIVSDVFAWVKSNPPINADILFADPPYGDAYTDDHLDELMALLATSNILSPDAIIIAEQRSFGRHLSTPPAWRLITERRYGHARLTLCEARKV
ncbi:MAG: RsmD family RNA methyltransferase [Kiritimatiellaeota bacterium]|nr:RsmD family RNA methyltransferase [Kiritimatiellota bacterium]